MAIITKVDIEFKGQRGAVLKLLWPGQPVSCLELGRASLQYQARLWELRRAGFDIRKVHDEFVNGIRHTAYKLFRLEQQKASPSTVHPVQPTQQQRMFEMRAAWTDPDMAAGK
jgi:hypothetical protein